MPESQVHKLIENSHFYVVFKFMYALKYLLDYSWLCQSITSKTDLHSVTPRTT